MPKLVPPDNGVTVRMYRQGHGDCFLLALPRRGGGDPVYVLIDCGLKPGSQDFVHKKPIGEIVDHIGESTGQHLDLAVITHEHQDHLNGIWKKNEPYFGDFAIDEAWMSWTESPDDDLANDLRRRHKDTLVGLVEARRKLALAVGEGDIAVRRLDDLLSLELGGGADEPFAAAEMLAAASDPAKSGNKQGLKLIKDKAAEQRGVVYLFPGDGPRRVGASDVRAYVLGPPHDENLIMDEDPKGSEAFPDDDPHGFTFAAAAAAGVEGGDSPFRSRYDALYPNARYGVPFEAARTGGDPFFTAHYGAGEDGKDDRDGIEVSDNALWRRMDNEWLYSAENLALKLNSGINNTSLVLAFELPASKKVLFFVGDAQRGNWISWDDNEWQSGGQTVTARDLMSRAVLYKVGHHGSHNATLDGKLSDDYPNLAWMGTGAAAGEFAAMITAVNEWALTVPEPPWVHPLPSIKRALMRKTQGRVFQTDTDKPARPSNVSAAVWNEFLGRCVFDDLYFDYQVMDA